MVRQHDIQQSGDLCRRGPQRTVTGFDGVGGDWTHSHRTIHLESWYPAVGRSPMRVAHSDDIEFVQLPSPEPGDSYSGGN